jgi:hypothetical protein
VRAAKECQSIISNLIDGKAKRQTVAFAKEQGTSTVLQIASVRINYDVLFDPDRAGWLRELSQHHYTGLLARDDRNPGCTLCDGRTRLSTVFERSLIEHVTPSGERPPLTWAFCRRNNAPSIKAFSRNSFHPDARGEQETQ